MIEGARQLPIQHLTIRVPWHDNGWNGTICNNPCGNNSCTILPRIATGRDDTFESTHAGESIEELEAQKMPPCVDEHGTVMAPFPISKLKNHPYSQSSPDTHGHFADTPFTIPAYAAATVPFSWMLREQVENNENGNANRMEELKLGYFAEQEPKLNFTTPWVQEGKNQRILLDTFFSAAKPEDSLIFFYAKRTPLAEDPRRVIVGVGRVKTVGNPTEYRYIGEKRPEGKLHGYLWERNVEHSIRPNGKDGFFLPYHAVLEAAEQDENFDLSACAAFCPDEYFAEYSYGTELLPPDGAIASLLVIEKAIKAMREVVEAPWEDYLQWIDNELNRLWEVRGAFPGLGAALQAFGLPHGNLLAWYLVGDAKRPTDLWPVLSEALDNPQNLPSYLREGIALTQKQKWQMLPETRRNLLKLLARFNLSNDQALRWYQETERDEAGIAISDEDILKNPYRIYEEDHLQPDPIAFAVIDRGLFPPEMLRNEFPVPEPSRVHEAIDARRVRAVMIQTLEEAAIDGHTLLPSSWAVHRIRERPMKPECPLDSDTLSVVEDTLAPWLIKVPMSDDIYAWQLERFQETSKLISAAVTKRRNGKANLGDFDWTELVNQAIGSTGQTNKITEDDKKARKEKTMALQEIYRSRISVLIGAAGTGKSTLLKALCAIDSVRDNGILLLAPTGKARVRLEQASGMVGAGKTIAQFLNGLQRYDGQTGRYYVNANARTSSTHKTVVIDECSMLTEEQLAALLDSVKGVERLVLVGDPKQLPPIGAGRPYVDIVQYLKPDGIDSLYPIVAKGYAELTITMRQEGNGNIRTDVLLANAFSGRTLDAGADEVWHSVAAGETPYVKTVRWNQPEQLQELLINELVSELGLESKDDEVGFEQSLGGVASEYEGKINVFFNSKFKERVGAAEKAEDWQILSPVRQSQAGVLSLNRAIQHCFRKHFLDMAVLSGYKKKITSPAGPEGIIYGDKVINILNSSRRAVYPDKDGRYVANGDIGVVTGHRKMKGRQWPPVDIEVELASQPGFSYKFKPWEFSNLDKSPPLELAYALTTHKTQGSEFGKTFLIVPNPCRLLSREMLYTALTRHKNKVIILHQGDFRDLQRFSHDQTSEVAKRMTNLFKPSQPVEVKISNTSVFLDNNLVYRTERGELVRSKSEWIIADKLYAAGIDYQYEQPLTLGGIERFPDFTIVDDDSGKTWYWEHNGMLTNKEYFQRWERKLSAYKKQGILPISDGGGENGTLLITEEKAGAGLDADKIASNIALILEG
jgi:hypothetical protein